ncbi:MAG: hypothetical protein HGA87_01110 [Desulfobulbaceae bacterium]|nr:hypothetical protein [Desulfobulbaceae bacterium]
MTDLKERAQEYIAKQTRNFEGLEIISDLLKENERLSSLLYGGRCVWCGTVIGADKQNQDISDEELRQHVLNCEKHPKAVRIAELESFAHEHCQTIAELRAELAECELVKEKFRQNAAGYHDFNFEEINNERIRTQAIDEVVQKMESMKVGSGPDDNWIDDVWLDEIIKEVLKLKEG